MPGREIDEEHWASLCQEWTYTNAKNSPRIYCRLKDGHETMHAGIVLSGSRYLWAPGATRHERRFECR